MPWAGETVQRHRPTTIEGLQWPANRVYLRRISQPCAREHRCRSSGVEHSLGKGEVESSNLSGSTTTQSLCGQCSARISEHLCNFAAFNRVERALLVVWAVMPVALADRLRRGLEELGCVTAAESGDSAFEISMRARKPLQRGHAARGIWREQDEATRLVACVWRRRCLGVGQPPILRLTRRRQLNLDRMDKRILPLGVVERRLSPP